MSAVTSSSSSSSSPSPSSSACAACKYQRRKCTSECALAPYFPADKQQQFLNVHRLFGVSNILKILKSIPQSKRQDAINAIIYQSNLRAEDPSGGCYRLILHLQRNIDATYNELQSVLTQIHFFRSQFDATGSILLPQDPQGQLLLPQHCAFDNYCFNYDHTSLVAGFDDAAAYMLNVGNELLPEDMLLQKPEGADQHNAFRVADGDIHLFGDNNVSNCSTLTAICSSKNEVKAETSLTEQVLEDDLKSAASYFTLKNYNTSAI